LIPFGSKKDVPLIIDQPENDLDNHLITGLVVKQLQDNKSRRQIIVVIHNPNIVVNGDAEMVHVMGFKNGQCHPVAQGALQEPEVRSNGRWRTRSIKTISATDINETGESSLLLNTIVGERAPMR